MATKTIPAGKYGWVGSYVRLGKGKKLKSIDVTLYPNGRCVGLIFWPRADNDYSKYAFSYGIRATSCEIIEGSISSIGIHKSGAYVYVNTSDITSSHIVCRFYFDDQSNIVNYEDILVALYNATSSTGALRDYINYDDYPLKFESTKNIKSPLSKIGCLCYDDKNLSIYDLNIIKGMISQLNDCSILFENLQAEYLNQNENDSSNSVYINNIKCTNLEYRTLSEPRAAYNVETPDLYNNGWHDGGETLFSCYNDSKSKDGVSLDQAKDDPSRVMLSSILISSATLSTDMRKVFDYNTPNKYNHKVNYIVNLRGKNDSNETSFIEDYDIKMGRLHDVKFSNPDNPLSEANPRYVFKRSRLKFTFNVPDKTKNGYRSFVLRYKVNTGVRYISEKTTINKTQNRGWIACKYDANRYKGKETFSLVICPRDEGVLDNSYFNITFEWAYHISGIDGADWTKGSQITYYFKTYQKPQINITYPKIIRNSATINKNDDITHRRFKLLTYNNFSNFVDENGLCNKYVSDALNVMYTTQPSDGSIFSTFVRFYLAEFRYGRMNNPDKDITLQKSVQSENSADYATKNQIYEKESSNMRTAYISATQICDGSPILFSGRVENNDLLNYVAENKIWTFNKWDKVDIDNSPITYNSFKVSYSDKLNTYTTPEKIKDHYHRLNFVDQNSSGSVLTLNADEKLYVGVEGKTIKQEVTDLILFRAGYIYLLKLRAFHGAATGGIYNRTPNNTTYNAQYGSISEIDKSGFYDYSNLKSYGVTQEKTSNSPNTENIHPYNDGLGNGNNSFDDINYYKYHNTFNENGTSVIYPWNGAPDGTAGYDPEHENINRTYPGFSEIDYTLIQPLCPFSSTSNIILKHPSSHETGVNQSLTFSYRHLSKNLSGLDDWRLSNGKFEKGFGTNATGIQNTMTRIAAMHKSAIDTIIASIQNDVIGNTGPFTDKNTNRNYIGIWTSSDEFFEKLKNQQTPKLKHESIDKYEYNNDLLDYDYKIFLYPGKLYNHLPYNNSYLAYKYAEACYDINNSFNNALYSSKDNKYSKFITGYINNAATTDENPYNIDMDYPFTSNSKIYFPEAYVNNYNAMYYNDYNNNESIDSNGICDDCSGNVYRWQVVINAINKDSEKIQINNSDDTGKYKLYLDLNNLKSNANDNNNNYWCNLIHNDNTNSITNKLSYNENIQTKYYYEDVYSDDFEEYTNKYETDAELGTVTKNRFCIAEFAGMTNASFANNVFYNYTKLPPTWPANYITKNENKFFNINNYGKLFLRVSADQDCECGTPTSSYGLLFKGSSAEPEDMKELSRNIYPLTRISHYLYFKTRIRTSYVTLIRLKYKSTQNMYECKGYTTTEFGTTHNGDDESSSITYHSILAFIGYNNNHPEFKIIEHDESDSELDLLSYDLAKNKLFSNPASYNCNLDDNYLINFGNKGFSEVYGEDNYNWGRCLSAEDNSAIALTEEGTSSGTNIETFDYQGGIETPILTRYTPLLQPKLDSITIGNGTINDRIINAVVYSDTNNIEFLAHDGNSIKKIKSKELTLNIHYPCIAENGTYKTRLANGGMAITVTDKNGNNISPGFANYNIDVDSSEAALNKPNPKQNTDFLGGYGICTAYTVLLVPSNPNKNNLSNIEKQYQQNTNGHWNYFKQPANYYSKYKSNDGYIEKCIYDVESQAQNNTYYKGKTILVAHKVKPNLKTDEYLQTPNDGKRAIISIPLNIQRIRQRKPYTSNVDELNEILNQINEDKGNTLVSGTTYDLVIIPIYTDDTCTDYNFVDGAGTINNKPYCGGKRDRGISYYGSNPLVLYNFLTTNIGTEGSTGGGGSIIPDPTDPPTEDDSKPDPPIPLDKYVLDTDPAIIFPNINKHKYDLESGDYKELPGFWLNNSFKLILRLPSYRKTPLFDGDELTIEQQSNNELTRGNSINDFEFSDIQIHIGQYKNIENYMDNINNAGADQIELAGYDIISYRHFWDKNVFSKKLNDNEAINDDRDKATAGGLNNDDENYKNRFIEVNLSNAYFLYKDPITGEIKEEGISAKDPEGMYIQFRVKTAYNNGVESQCWTQWYGGISDGNYTWWGTKGRDYCIPLRNYSEIFTEYRSLIKESYPGSYSKIGNELINGQGSLNTQPYINENSKTNPQSSISYNDHYYFRGNGNHDKSFIIPTINEDHEKTNECKFGYLQTHDLELTLNNDDSIKMHNQMYEMLYLYYIINNLSKLYYKPDNNVISNVGKFISEIKFNNNDGFSYHLQVPKINDKEYILEFNNGVDPEKFYMNRYYRRIIEKSDFDYLNKRIKDLSEYIRNNIYHGKYVTEYNSGNYDNVINSSTISPSKDQLNFDKIARQVIGHDLFGTYGQGNYNNLNFTKVTTNYMLEIWNKIMLLTNPYRTMFDTLKTKDLDSQY